MMLVKLTSVFIGGGIGSCLRFLVNHIFAKYSPDKFYLSTLVVNVLGSFLAGFLFVLLLEEFHINPNLKFFLLVGFCGGLTTFSTFSLEAMELYKDAQIFQSLLYVFLNLSVSLLAVILGAHIAKLV